jgi:hypothetical protein
VNPGEVWALQDGSRRLVLSHSTYNSSALGRVITAVVSDPPATFDPFAVDTPAGTVFADRLAMHPRDWLVSPVGRVDHAAYRAIGQHLRFLLAPPR